MPGKIEGSYFLCFFAFEMKNYCPVVVYEEMKVSVVVPQESLGFTEVHAKGLY